MAWVLTKNLQAFRDQMNSAFPNRDKASDGTIGDAAHAAGTSGHNPDDSPYDNAEWDGDSDTKSEVRAIDIDDDLRDPDVTMEDVLQHLLRLAKSDKNFPIRYMIYNKRIYKSTNGWAKETYTGPSPHTEHIHLSGARSDAADERNYDYRLDELVALSDADLDKIIAKLRNSAALSDTDIGKIATKTWAYELERPDSTTNPKQKSSAGAYQRWNDIVNDNAANKVINALAPAIAAIAGKADLEPKELQAIKDALKVPTAQENATAVLQALNGTDVTTLVEVLHNGLTSDKLAALKAAL
jgi:hypothetical protein